MRDQFGFGEEIASSSRIECYFNHIKNRVFKDDNLPKRVDSFVEKLILYYRGDHLLVQSETGNIDFLPKTDDESLTDCDDFISDDQNNAILSNNVTTDDLMACDNDNFCVNNNSVDDQNNYILFENFTDKALVHVSPDENGHNFQNNSAYIHSTPVSSTQCIACNNGDFPSGLHKCLHCKKSVHLFGYSIDIGGTEEDCGELRLCLECD